MSDILLSRAGGNLVDHAGPPPTDHHVLGEFPRWTFSGIVQTMPLFFLDGKSLEGLCATRICGSLFAYLQGMSLKYHATAIRLQ